MKNKAIADKHLIEKILNKEITSLRNNKKDLVAHFRSVEEELRYELKTKTLLVSKLEDEIDFSNKYIEGFDAQAKRLDIMPKSLGVRKRSYSTKMHLSVSFLRWRQAWKNMSRRTSENECFDGG